MRSIVNFYKKKTHVLVLEKTKYPLMEIYKKQKFSEKYSPLFNIYLREIIVG